jgi:hypothetical protein
MIVKFPLLVTTATLNESGAGVAMAFLSGFVNEVEAPPPVPPPPPPLSAAGLQDTAIADIATAIDARKTIRRGPVNSDMDMLLRGSENPRRS